MEHKDEKEYDLDGHTDQDENQDAHPNYHYKWMLALLAVAALGTFVFSWMMRQ